MIVIKFFNTLNDFLNKKCRSKKISGIDFHDLVF